jgi:hypothetical protein
MKRKERKKIEKITVKVATIQFMLVKNTRMVDM